MTKERTQPGPLFGAIKTVLWSFLGIRRRSAHESETAPLSPLRILAAGMFVAVMFVVTLVAVASFVVAGMA